MKKLLAILSLFLLLGPQSASAIEVMLVHRVGAPALEIEASLLPLFEEAGYARISDSYEVDIEEEFAGYNGNEITEGGSSSSAGGTGDVSGPASNTSTYRSLAFWNGTDGRTLGSARITVSTSDFLVWPFTNPSAGESSTYSIGRNSASRLAINVPSAATFAFSVNGSSEGVWGVDSLDLPSGRIQWTGNAVVNNTDFNMARLTGNIAYINVPTGYSLQTRVNGVSVASTTASEMALNIGFASPVSFITTSTILVATGTQHHFAVSSTAPITISLPLISTMTSFREYRFKDYSNNSATFPITVVATSTDLFTDGATSTTINTNNAAQGVKLYGTRWGTF